MTNTHCYSFIAVQCLLSENLMKYRTIMQSAFLISNIVDNDCCDNDCDNDCSLINYIVNNDVITENVSFHCRINSIILTY